MWHAGRSQPSSRVLLALIVPRNSYHYSHAVSHAAVRGAPRADQVPAVRIRGTRIFPPDFGHHYFGHMLTFGSKTAFEDGQARRRACPQQQNCGAGWAPARRCNQSGDQLRDDQA